MVPPHTSDFQIDFDALEKAISIHTKGVIINSPNNPSGAVYSKETIQKLAALLTKKSEENGTPIFYSCGRTVSRDRIRWRGSTVCDKILCKHTGMLFLQQISVTAGRAHRLRDRSDEVTESKTVYAAIAGAGRALGYVCAPSMFQKVIASCVGNTGDIELYKKNRDLLYDGLTRIGYECFKPQGAFFLHVCESIGAGCRCILRACQGAGSF